MRSDYTYEFKNNVLIIIDLNKGNKSVTNDMENVLSEIHLIKMMDLTNYKIIYKDSNGIYDSVAARNYGTLENPNYEIDFISLNITSEQIALTTILIN